MGVSWRDEVQGLVREVDMAAREDGRKQGDSLVHSISGKECNAPAACPLCVRASALGRELTDTELTRLCAVAEFRKLAKDEVLIAEGEFDDKLYAITAGKMEVFRVGDAGRTITLQRLEAGSLTGELACLEGLKRTATVRATEDSCVVSLRRDCLEDLVATDSKLAFKVMRAIVRSAHDTVGNLDTAYTDFVRYVST